MPTTLNFESFSLVLRIAMIVILYLFILQIVLVARRDLRYAAFTPLQQAKKTIGHLSVIDSGQAPVVSGSHFDIVSPMTLGRGPTNTIVLDSSMVSSENTRLFLQNKSLWVEDLKSKNGTFVNERQVIVPVAIKPGDILRVGDVRFRITT